MTPAHQEDLQALANAHFTTHSNIGITLAHMQNHAYSTGVERGKELAKQAAIEAGTIPPTLCQTIHLGQPGVTVEPCLMLGPDEEEVACLLFTAPGTEVRLTWPTQTQALAVLAAATEEPEAAKECTCWKIGDHWLPEKHSQGCPIHNPGTSPQPAPTAAQDVAHCAERLLAKGVQKATEAVADSEWKDESEAQSPKLTAAIQAREEAISQVHGLRTQLRDLVAAAQPIISALAGPSHHIREMQATVKIDENNPIIVLAKLCAAYCKQREAQHHD